jgi:hypothetical protein
MFTVSQFEADLSGGLFLARRLDPFTGTPLAASHIVNLQLLAAQGECEIFDDWSLMRRPATSMTNGGAEAPCAANFTSPIAVASSTITT